MEYLHQTADAGDSGCRRLYQTADAGVSLSDSGCWSLSILQRMQETLNQTGDAGGDSLLDSGCRSLSIRQRMMEFLHQTADAGDSIRQRMHESLYQSLSQTAIRQRMQEQVNLSIRKLMQEIISGCRKLSIRQRMQ